MSCHGNMLYICSSTLNNCKIQEYHMYIVANSKHYEHPIYVTTLLLHIITGRNSTVSYYIRTLQYGVNRDMDYVLFSLYYGTTLRI